MAQEARLTCCGIRHCLRGLTMPLPPFRRVVFQHVLLLCSCVAAGAGAGTRSAPSVAGNGDQGHHGAGRTATPKRNVLLMISDDLRPELSVYNQPHAHTPHLEQLAARALRFDRAYCQIAVCAPSRMASVPWHIHECVCLGFSATHHPVWQWLDFSWIRTLTK